MSQPAGGYAAPANLTHRGTASSSSITDVYTFSAKAIGTAPASGTDRYVIVCAAGSRADVATYLKEISIGGVDGFCAVHEASPKWQEYGGVAFGMAKINTGTTADIVITFEDADRCLISWWTVEVEEDAPFGPLRTTKADNADPLSLNITSDDNSIVFAGVHDDESEGTTWTGLTEQSDDVVNYWGLSTAHKEVTTGGSETISANLTTADSMGMSIVFGYKPDSGITYEALTAATDDNPVSNAFTFSSHGLGTAASDRKIILGITALHGSTRTLSSVTIGGVTATITVQANGSSADHQSIVIADVPTGATGDIVVTFSASTTVCGIVGVAVYGLSSSTAVATYTSRSTSSGTAKLCALFDTEVTLNTFVFMMGSCGDNNTTTHTFEANAGHASYNTITEIGDATQVNDDDDIGIAGAVVHDAFLDELFEVDVVYNATVNHRYVASAVFS